MPEIAALARLPATSPQRFMAELGLSVDDHWAVATAIRVAPTMSRLNFDYVAAPGLKTEIEAVAILKPGQWPDQLAQFRVRWVGLVMETDSEPDYPHLWLPHLKLALQAWMRIVGDPRGKVYAEARWHPERGEEFALKWTDPTTTAADRRLADRGLQLITDIEASQRRGKKPGDGTVFVNEKHFLDELHSAIQAECKAKGTRDPRGISVRRLVRRMPCSSSSFYEYLPKVTGFERLDQYLANYAEFAGQVMSQE